MTEKYTNTQKKEWTKTLKERFQEPGQVNSILGLYRFFKGLIPKDFIASFLKSNPYYQISKQNFKSNDTTAFNVTDPGYLQIDLIYSKSLYPPEVDVEKDKVYQYILVSIVLFTRKVFVYPIKNKTVQDVQTAVMELKKDYPAAKILQSDNGKEFKFEKEWLQKNGFKQVFSSAYNPTSQAFVERINQVVKQSLFKYYQKTGDNPLEPKTLEKIVDSINDQPNRTTGVIPNVALLPENQKKLIEQNEKRLKKVADSQQDNILEVGNKVRVSLNKMKITTKERNKYKTNKMWLPKWSNQLFEISKVIQGKLYRAVRYRLKAFKEDDKQFVDNKFFLRRDLQVVPDDTPNDFQPAVDLIKRDTEQKRRGRPALVDDKKNARSAWGAIWAKAKKFTTMINDKSGDVNQKKERFDTLVKMRPGIELQTGKWMSLYDETQLLSLQRKNFEKLMDNLQIDLVDPQETQRRPRTRVQPVQPVVQPADAQPAPKKKYDSSNRKGVKRGPYKKS